MTIGKKISLACLVLVALTIILMTRLGILGACIAMPVRHAVRIVILSTCFIRSVCEQRFGDAGLDILGVGAT